MPRKTHIQSLINTEYIKLEDNIRAKQELQKYIDQFPQGEFVDKARTYLKQLD